MSTSRRFDRRAWRAGLGVVTSALAVTAAFAWPYLEGVRPAERDLDRFWPLSRPWGLQVTLDAAGRPVEWVGYTLEDVPGVQALTGLDADSVAALKELGVKDATTARAARVMRTTARVLKADGTTHDLVHHAARTASGHYTFAERDPNATTTYVYRPPMRVLPARVRPGERWTQKGTINDRVDYAVDGRVESASMEGREACVRVTRVLTLGRAGTALSTSTTVEHYCATVGYVGGETRDAQGARRTVEYGAGGTREAWLPPPPPAAPPVAPERLPTRGELTFVGRVTPGNRDRVSDTPALLGTPSGVLAVTANVLDVVTAFDAQDDVGRVAWRVRPGGSVTGGVTVDASRGRVYFGSSARRLYAVDGRGLPLWSVPLGDHVATRPLVAGDTVIAVTEDGTATGVDPSGEVRWTAALGAISRASPVLVGRLAVFANQNGDLIALRARDGQAVWRSNLGGPVTAPLVASGGSVYAGTDTGDVARVETRDGRVAWRTKAGRGGAVGSAPAVTDAWVVVNAGGQLVTLVPSTGEVLATNGADYVGAPLAHDGQVYAATRDEVRQLTPHLRVRSRTPGPLGDGRFVTGPVVAGDALLLGDSQGGVWRYGARDARTLRANGQVETDATRAGLAAVTLPPVVLPDRTVLVDDEGGVYTLGADGAARGVTTLTLDGLTGRAGNDGRSLVALPDRTRVRLLDATGRERWSRDVGAVVAQPPVFTRDAVVVVTTRPDVVALDVASGRERWRAPLTQSLVGAPVTDGSTVWVSSPLVALDARDGRTLWRGQSGTFGSALLDARENRMYVRAVRGDTPHLLAVDTTTGEVRWRSVLPPDATSIFEPLVRSAEVLVVPTDGPTLIGVDRADGRLRWTHTGGAPRWGAPGADDRYVAYVARDGHVTLLDSTSGAVAGRWRGAELTLKDDPYQRAQPTFDGGVLLVPRGYDLARLDLPTPGSTP